MKIKIGAQIYTLRKELHCEHCVKPVFEFLASAKCEVVELAAMPDISAAKLAKISEETGVKICSTHSPYDRIINDIDKLADEHLTYGAKIIGIGSMPSNLYKYDKYDDVMRFSDAFNAAAEKVKDRDITLAYHNHAGEFKTKLNGKTVMDVLVENATENVGVCLDLFWAYVGGADVKAVIDKIADKLKVLHLKDYKKRLFRTNMCPPGDGTLNLVGYLKQAETYGTEFAVVEVDEGGEPRDNIIRGVDYILKNY